MSENILSPGLPYSARITKIEQSECGIFLLWLQVIDQFDHLHQPGQYLQLRIGEEWSYFSIASLPGPQSPLELHIHTQDIAKVAFLLDAFSQQRLVDIRYAFGLVRWPVNMMSGVFLCRGTGFAPSKALIEGGLARNNDRPIHLFWETDSSKDCYFEPWLKSTFAKSPNFHATLIGPKGVQLELKHDRLTYSTSSLSDCVSEKGCLAPPAYEASWFYLCASPARVHEWAQELQNIGVSLQQIGSDVFEYAPLADGQP